MTPLRSRRQLLEALSGYSSAVHSFPATPELSKLAAQLYDAGLLAREKRADDNGLVRWAYKRTDAGSRAIGA